MGFECPVGETNVTVVVGAQGLRPLVFGFPNGRRLTPYNVVEVIGCPAISCYAFNLPIEAAGGRGAGPELIRGQGRGFERFYPVFRMYKLNAL